MLGISRREADSQIEAGRVQVNGAPARLGHVIQPGRDDITIDNGQNVSQSAKKFTYILMNKPLGTVCSRRKQGDVPTIYELLPPHLHHLKVAGRLDKDSCGLLLLTDDGDTIFKLTHPKFNKQKIYIVRLDRPLKQDDQDKIITGIEIEDGISQFQVKPSDSEEPNEYTVTMHEGRNRQIRRTFKQLGYTVTFLQRTEFGEYKLSTLTDKLYLQI